VEEGCHTKVKLSLKTYGETEAQLHHSWPRNYIEVFSFKIRPLHHRQVLDKRLGRTETSSGRCPAGNRTQAVQPVARRYTDWAFIWRVWEKPHETCHNSRCSGQWSFRIQVVIFHLCVCASAWSLQQLSIWHCLSLNSRHLRKRPVLNVCSTAVSPRGMQRFVQTCL
jgi:hypothetical protein